jgi:hypothetical protein
MQHNPIPKRAEDLTRAYGGRELRNNSGYARFTNQQRHQRRTSDEMGNMPRFVFTAVGELWVLGFLIFNGQVAGAFGTKEIGICEVIREREHYDGLRFRLRAT